MFVPSLLGLDHKADGGKIVHADDDLEFKADGGGIVHPDCSLDHKPDEVGIVWFMINLEMVSNVQIILSWTFFKVGQLFSFVLTLTLCNRVML